MTKKSDTEAFLQNMINLFPTLTTEDQLANVTVAWMDAIDAGEPEKAAALLKVKQEIEGHLREEKAIEARRHSADRIDGFDRDDLGESPDW